MTDTPFVDFVLGMAANIVIALVIFFVGRWLVKIVVGIVKRYMKRAGMDEMLIDFTATILTALLMAFVVVAALNQVGVDTTSIVALIAAAGLAVGLALQDGMQNFASGVLLVFFKPFRHGDFVEAAGMSGIVQEITLFTSTFRTPDNRDVIVPNHAIYSGTITNYSRQETRRVDMVFGIGYDDDMRKAKEIMQSLLDADERILDEPAPVVAVAELADSSVNFNVRPWVKQADYWAVKADITEKVKLAFDDSGISIPYPQMDVHVNGNGGGNSSGDGSSTGDGIDDGNSSSDGSDNGDGDG